MTITTPAATPESNLAGFGFSTHNYAKSRESESSDLSYNPHMLILAVQKLISQPQPVTAPGFWDTHFLSLNPETGTFRVDTKAPSFDKAAFEESLIPEGERARMAEVDKVTPGLKWGDYLRWNPDAGIDLPITTVEKVLSLEDIQFIFQRAMKEAASLPDESLSSEQKILLQQRLKDFAASLRIALTPSYYQALPVKLLVKDSSMSEAKEIKVPLSLSEHSPFFLALFFSPIQRVAGAGAGAAASRELALTLPDTFTVDDFELYLTAATGTPLMVMSTASDVVRLLTLCEYFDDSSTAEKIAERLWLKDSSITIDTVSEILQLCQEGRLKVSSPAVHKALSTCINTLIEQAQTQEGGLEKALSDLLEGALSKATGLYDLEGYRLLAQIPLELRLSGELTNTALEKLSILFPNVVSLNLYRTTGISLLPQRWDNSLKHLDISHSAITRIDRPLPSLESFRAIATRTLTDISGLSGLTSLREIHITGTAVRAAPTGCMALESFIAYSARSLDDISGLSGLTRLKEIDISVTNVRAAPTGCSALESFIAYFARSLDDISGLNGLTRLKTIDISLTAVVAAPTGCTGLESFVANECAHLTDATGLLGCPKLMQASLPERIPNEIKRLFTSPEFTYRMKNSSSEERRDLFRGLAPNVQNRLKWLFWLFSGMPEGDPEFGTHLFERNPRDSAVEKTLYLFEGTGWLDLFDKENITGLNHLHTILQDPKSSNEEKWAASSSVHYAYQHLILHSIWVACGSDPSADPNFALNLVKDNPNSPVIKEVIAKLIRQLSG